ERDAVVLAADELLAPAGEPGADDVVGQRRERVTHDRRVVLAVDDRNRALRHSLAVTSFSIRAVYFSNASVSSENWMIRSCPWYGYLRQIVTCWSTISITL